MMQESTRRLESPLRELVRFVVAERGEPGWEPTSRLTAPSAPEALPGRGGWSARDAQVSGRLGGFLYLCPKEDRCACFSAR